MNNVVSAILARLSHNLSRRLGIDLPQAHPQTDKVLACRYGVKNLDKVPVC